MIHIRSATPADIPAILATEQAATSYPWAESSFQSSFSERYFNAVALINEQVVGFYIGELVAGEASLFDIAVHPDQQGKAIGKALLSHFLDEAERRQATDCWLEVRASNHKAIALYHQHGFHQVGVRPAYYPAPGGKEDAILMAMSLAMPSL
jgi:ribosomal-protein-alanine N-acetyltransferase